MNYVRMPIEIESPEQMGYDNLEYNLTESSVTDMKLGDLNLNNLQDLIVAYGDHVGHPKLRQLIAEEAGVQPDDVLITTGAAMALFIVSTTLLGKGDKLIVEQPNYATNIETPRVIGAKIDFLHLKIEQKFHLSLEEIEHKMTPDTKLLSITVPHNPTGTVIPRGDLDAIISMTQKKNIKLLVDETYRDMTFTDKLPVAASLATNIISVSSLSKTFGLPGIRVGWLICRDKEMMKKFLAAKEQMIICGSIVDEEIAYRFMETRQQKLPAILAEIQSRLSIVKEWMTESSDILEWIEPKGGVVCFPRIIAKITDFEEFYQILNEQFKTFVGPGHWFEMEKCFMRIGYGWPKTHQELKKGLENISKAVRICLEKQKH